MNKILNLIGAVNSAVPDSIKQFTVSLTGVGIAQANTPDSFGEAKKALISVAVAIISQVAFTLSKKLIDAINKKFKGENKKG